MAIMPKYHRCVRLIDIDGTIVKKKDPHEYFRTPTDPLPGAIEVVNRWFDAGDYIVFWTARVEEHRSHTIKMLNNLGFNYHDVMCRKPYSHDIHIYDDNSIVVHKVERDGGIGTLDEEDLILL